MPAFRPLCVTCGEPAVAWIRGGDVCHDHYVEIFRIEGERHSVANSLLTQTDKAGYIRDLLARPKNPRAWMQNPKSQRAAEMAAEVSHQPRRIPREPGSDDE